MNITAEYMAFIFALILVVINVFTTREAMLFPTYSVGKKAFIIAIIWLLPIIGLVFAYKQLHLDASFDTDDNGDGTQHYPSGSINND